MSEKMTIITKNYSKKIVYISCSPIKIDDEVNGFVFLGKDITYDWERHHNLIPGHSYIIPEKTRKSSFQTFSNFLLSGYQGIYLTRTHPHQIQTRISTEDSEIVFIGKHSIDELPAIETIQDFSKTIHQFISTHNRGIVLIDGLHYFITRFSFHEVLEALYEINERVFESTSILLLYLNPEILHPDHIAILKSEFEPMPSKKVEDIKISDDLSEILFYIKEESERNALVSLKKIISRFDIVYYTATKRVNQLIDEGLVFTKKYGKSRVVHLTEKAKSLLERQYSH
jgi:predicted transcriptional regulator